MSGRDKKNKQADRATDFVVGLQKHLSSVPQLTFGNASFTPAEVEAKLSALATLRSNANAAKTSWDARLAEESAEAPPLRVFLAAFERFVRATYGDSPDFLADFGLVPRKVPTQPTADELVLRAAKAKATRKARGTMGKKKKLAIKGDVAGIVMAPITMSLNTPRSS